MEEVKMITIVSTMEGDWESVYVNDIMFAEGHSVPWFKWLELGIAINTDKYDIEELTITDDGLEEIDWCFPARLSEISVEYLV